MKSTHRILLAALAGLLVVTAAFAQEDLYLEITQPGLTRVSVATPAFLVLPGTPSEAARTFQSTLDGDLEAAAPIAVLDRRLYGLVEETPQQDVLYQRWRAIGAQFLLTGSLASAGGQLVVETRLVDLTSGELAFAKRYRAGLSAAQVMANTLANDLVKVFTGRPGPFLSKIAFVSDRTGASELWLMDWDGSNPRQLTKHNSIAVGPAWSPNGQTIAFTSFLRNRPDLFLLVPKEGYLKPLWSEGGVNSSPSFSPDGKTVFFASSTDGNTDIYAIPAAGGTPQRLTSARAIDTQPAISPNGRQIAFTSTRSGTPQIYLMDADGSNVRRLTFQGSFNDEAAWAPDGLRLACTTKHAGHFQIATVDVINGDERVISAPGNNESPTFSPDGSMLAFSSDRTGTPQVYVTDSQGRPRQLTTEGSSHSPAWSPSAD